MKKHEYKTPEVEVMEFGIDALLEASPVPVSTDTDAETPALGRPFDELPFEMNL